MSMHSYPTPDEEDYPKSDATTANRILGVLFVLSTLAVSIYLVTALITWVKSW
jgi:hypothetical protein